MAIVLGTTCSGCDYSLLDVEGVLDVLQSIEPVFWPTAADFKLSDIEAMQDGEIDLAIWEGAVNNDETEEMAKLVRRKSKVVLAYGSCACFGGIYGLANVSTKKGLLNVEFGESLSNESRGTAKLPQTNYQIGSKELTLPDILNTVKYLADAIEVDYFMPGCPPPLKVIGEFFTAALSGKLPQKGTVLGLNKGVCDQCEMKREKKVISELKRFPQVIHDPTRCLLEQGVLCMGPATRAGCDAACPSVGIPCRGCMGPPPKVTDQGAKMLSALASIIGVEGEENLSEKDLNKMVDQFKDPLGYLYRFTLSYSPLKRAVVRGE